MTNLTHNCFLYVYFNSLHVSSNLVLIILSDQHTKRSPTQSGIHQRLYWYNWFSWWWARSCSKHVQNWNKYIEKNCVSSWSFTKNYHSSVFWSVMPYSRFKEPAAFTFRTLLLVHWAQRQKFVQNIGTYLYQSTWCHIAKALYLTALLLTEQSLYCCCEISPSAHC
jgi:hypothetical protein